VFETPAFIDLPNLVPKLHAIDAMLPNHRIHIWVAQTNPGHLTTFCAMYDWQLSLSLLQLVVQPGKHRVLAH
jgi:hypothetical protein